MVMITVANRMSPSRNAIAGMTWPAGETFNAFEVDDGGRPSAAIEPNSTRTVRKMAISATTKKGFRMLSSINIQGLPPSHVRAYLQSDLTLSDSLAGCECPGLSAALKPDPSANSQTHFFARETGAQDHK